MSLPVRFPYTAGASLAYSAERLADGLYYDFGDGTFKSVPATATASLPEGAGIHAGSYSATLASTPQAQWADGFFAISIHDLGAGSVTIAQAIYEFRGGVLAATPTAPANFALMTIDGTGRVTTSNPGTGSGSITVPPNFDLLSIDLQGRVATTLTPPTNFAALAIDIQGRVATTLAPPANWAALAIDGQGRVTPAGLPANFALLSIDTAGNVATVGGGSGSGGSGSSAADLDPDAGAALGGGSAAQFPATGAGLNTATGAYNGMNLVFTSGPNKGERRFVAAHTVTGSNHVFLFASPFTAPPADGDTFRVG